MSRARGAALLVLALLALGWAWARARPPTAASARPVWAGEEAFRVQPREAAPAAAAAALADLNALALGLLRHLRRRAGALSPAEAAAAGSLRRRYDPAGLAENSPRGPAGETAYAQGARVALCLRDRRSRALHPAPLLRFVFLHELAHLASEAPDHGPRFWEAFRWLLEEAERAGLYRSPDWARVPGVVYCGVPVAYNPRFDAEVGPLGP